MNKNETFTMFEQISKEYGVCDIVTRDGVHDRLRMGKNGRDKARFLACSRDGWMCLYYDERDYSWINEICSNGRKTFNDESYDYKCRVEPEQFEKLLQKTAVVLGVKKPDNLSIGTINKSLLERYMVGFKGALTQFGESVNFYSNSVFVKQEGYKNRILRDATACIEPSSWNHSDIGTGKISGQVIRAVNKAGNLVNQYPVMHFKDECEANPYETEHALYSLFCGNNDETAFNELTQIFGEKYGLIAYLFFIHDPKKYLPISPANFDERFAKLGIDYQTSYKCSWENYNGFITIISTIQSHLQSFLGVPVTLLDAHSFVWMMWFVDKYLEESALEEEQVRIVQKDTKAVISVRIGQSQYRKNLLDYWGSACSVTGCQTTELLIASHIKPWCECREDNEWIDFYNGLLLIPNLDKAFDIGYISFDENGKIMISERLTKQDMKNLGIENDMSLRKITDKHRKYLEYHRQNIYDKF